MWNVSNVVNGLNQMDSFKPYVAQLADDGVSVLLNDGNGHFAKVEPWDSDHEDFFVSIDCYEMNKNGELERIIPSLSMDRFGPNDWGNSFPDFVKNLLNECFE